ncbi:MAG: translation initiation factor IF-2, partial [Lachnospiraceae bacterium]|nr:translation initiation factor IF-2 [Lachnospiraceae bacterium]
MAKIRIYELAKELNKPSNDVLGFLQSKDIEVKTSSSSVEESVADMVRSHYKENTAAKAGKANNDNKQAEEGASVREEKASAKPEKAAAGDEVPVRDNAHNKEGSHSNDGSEDKDNGGDASHKKKKNIIFVSNPQNSKFSGQRQGGGGQNRSGSGQRQSGYNNSRPAANRPIKPLTPPSPTPAVNMVPDNQGQAKRPARTENKEAVRQKAPTADNFQAKQQGGNDRPAHDSNRDNRDNRENHDGRDKQAVRSQGARGNRDSRQQGNRPQGQVNDNRYQNRGGAGNGRPQGDRQNGFQRPYRPNSENSQGDRRGGAVSPASNRGYNGGERSGRGNERQGNQYRDNRDSKPGKSFAAEAGGKDMEKKREEEKRRFSQEKDKRHKKDHFYEEEENLKNRPGRFIKPEKKKEEKAEEVIKVITLPESITIKELADKMKLQPAIIIKKLFLEGKVVTVNQEISYEDAENIAMEYEILCEKEVKVDVIEELLKEEEENAADMTERPPVICVMGHVDHGKTSLLDAIRKTNVIDKEAGGITQHIGAYTVNVNGRSITFLDTPGHEAFTAMRMRGANATDIAILVVAADDGVMPQTIEAINHAKAAGIEIIVAVNKIDKPSANIDRVKQELAEYELIPEDWGGSTVFAPVSAKSGEGIDQLLEMILLSADILELKANPSRRARGLVIEAELDKGRGPVATVLVQKGTLRVGDFISAGASHGKVRAMIDDKGRRVKEATPSTPVEILGLSDVPSAGEVFIAHDSDKEAKSYADTYLAQNKQKKLEETRTRMSLEDLFSQIQEGNLKELNLIVKADVQGSVEAVRQSLLKLSNEEVVVKCIHGGVGAINESDVVLAGASNAIIIGFNVRPDSTAKATAEREGVDIRLYNVIY